MSKTEVVLSLGDKEAWASMELHGSCRKDVLPVYHNKTWRQYPWELKQQASPLSSQGISM